MHWWAWPTTKTKPSLRTLSSTKASKAELREGSQYRLGTLIWLERLGVVRTDCRELRPLAGFELVTIFQKCPRAWGGRVGFT